MKVIRNIKKIRSICSNLKNQGCSIGFVPTMGYLHHGHLSLIERSVKECGSTIISVFVNPVQFGPGEDYEKYPRDLNRDTELAGRSGADFVFYPDVQEMYGQDYKTFVSVRGPGSIMCGKSRPGHFDGVCTIVLKLFNIINPDRAYFGRKDYQQMVIIKKMVKDLNLEVKIIDCPTVREADGLAMSSRNKYLSQEQRSSASVLYRSLVEAASKIKKIKEEIFIRPETGKLSFLDRKALSPEDSEKLQDIKKSAVKQISDSGHKIQVDYFEFRNTENLDPVDDIKSFYLSNPEGRILIATAVRFGDTRLIDNIVI
jgi:pantoate--beta-alanine ligase